MSSCRWKIQGAQWWKICLFGQTIYWLSLFDYNLMIFTWNTILCESVQTIATEKWLKYGKNWPLKFSIAAVDLATSAPASFVVSSSFTTVIFYDYSHYHYLLAMLRAFKLALTYTVYPPGLPSLPFPIIPPSLAHSVEDWMRRGPGSTVFLSLSGTGSLNKLGSLGCWNGVIAQHTGADGWVSISVAINDNVFKCKGTAGHGGIWYSKHRESVSATRCGPAW